MVRFYKFWSLVKIVVICFGLIRKIFNAIFKLLCYYCLLNFWKATTILSSKKQYLACSSDYIIFFEILL